MLIIKGRIIKGLSNLFEIKTDVGILQAVPFGNVKKLQRVCVGDIVEIEKIENDNKYVISKVFPRKNQLIRPVITNIDQLIIIFTNKPMADLFLIDKLIISCIINNIQPVLVINKADLMTPVEIESFIKQYKNVVSQILVTSAENNYHINELKEILKNKLSVFAGQSAVGKSSLLNCISPNLNIKTNILSQRVDRGKHTTRTVEIFTLEDDIMIADTPGFSCLDFENFDPYELPKYYAEFDKVASSCKYSNCTHIHMRDNECAVAKAVSESVISKDRYDRYVILYENLKNKWGRRYD